MTELSIDRLAARLERLERQNRCWQAAIAILLFVLLTGAVWGNKPKVVEEIRARRFAVIGPNDEMTGRLDSSGLTLEEDAATIILINKGKNGSVDRDPLQPYITLAGPTGSIKLRLGLLPTKDHPEYKPSISISDRQHRILWAAP